MRIAHLMVMASVLVGTARADEVVILAGGDKEAGQAAAARVGGSWVKDLTKAFLAASVKVNEAGEKTVVVRLASGDYTGDLGSGAYAIPQLNNAQASLHIVGGWNATFEARDPFRAPSKVMAVQGRSAALWTLARNSKLKALVIDGLIFDPTASNAYRARALLPGTSCTQGFVHFTLLETDDLTVRNCVFMNSPSRALEPLIRAATPQATVTFSNTVFLNCLVPLRIDSARFKNKPARTTIDHCSFLLCWAMNPDPNTSNPCALEIGTKDAAGEVVITNNLFFANFGGAILSLNTTTPPMRIENNDFVGNGLLHGQSEPDAVAVVAQAGGRKQPLSVGQIEDVPGVTSAEGNVTESPGIGLSIGDVRPVDADAIKAAPGWQNDVNRILGRPLQGGKVEVGEFAPPQAWDPANPPFPQVEAAKRYGASPDLVR